MWLDTPLVLASGSATRRKLLEQAGLTVTVERPSAEVEQTAKSTFTGSPDNLALFLARAKAGAVGTRLSGLVLGADQTLLLGERVFDKPVDIRSAANQLADLQGKTHRLMSSLSLWYRHQEVWSHTDVAYLSIRSLTPQEIQRYVERVGSAVTASVGGYQIEGPGIQLFERVQGEYFTILGLPIIPLLTFLRGFADDDR